MAASLNWYRDCMDTQTNPIQQPFEAVEHMARLLVEHAEDILNAQEADPS